MQANNVTAHLDGDTSLHSVEETSIQTWRSSRFWNTDNTTIPDNNSWSCTFLWSVHLSRWWQMFTWTLQSETSWVVGLQLNVFCLRVNTSVQLSYNYTCSRSIPCARRRNFCYCIVNSVSCHRL
jgi:hypothetical protein